ncbi:phosphocarrier protein FPr [Andreprevotia lacus DSM 23236]|jgi:phosphocarrier protein FPr|uniref:phosphoenolpyruvate--protein phosphotransferase n=1 Tax=Andreprevotia lacus DSM 23236 TaxID=1121001 RepID=A0A1W1XB54_9NEIS|nr:phosphoenolpyruvate--protein phosphotransferase [Andreprevotia lacus]SMC21176.1 phosphocarrier protein FPr [Andreprevotia lacus DSM 23236]
MSGSPTIELLAPLSGVVVPLDQVPDPVFAQKMVGDGLAIDPISNQLLAPAAGTISQLHSASHAVTVKTDDGIEVLLHIGLDTVMLKGEGFKALVRVGDRVEAGQVLIEFDATYVAKHARSLLTEIIITNGDRVARYEPASNFVQAGKSVALTLQLAEPAGAAAAKPAGEAVSGLIRIPNPTGLHARPAAVLANAAKTFKSDIKLVRNGDEANAKSVVGIMGLEVQYGDQVFVKASGVDAPAVIKTLADLLLSGSGEDVGAAVKARHRPAPLDTLRPVAAKPKSDDPNTLVGVSASPGLAVGQVFQLKQVDIQVAEIGENPQIERRRFDAALREAGKQLEILKGEISDASKAEIFAAHKELLADPELIELAIAGLGSGKSAAFAWRAAYTRYAEKLSQLKNEVLAGRANDIRDVGQRVLRLIVGVAEARIELPANAILIAEDLTPSETASLDRSRVLGFATTGGGATSHVAILARSLNIPAICGIDEAAVKLANGTTVILNGSKGTLRLNPTDTEMAVIRDKQARLAKKRAEELAAAHLPPVTTDGQHIEVVANIGGLDEARQGVELGGEGVGLLRSEFLYLDRNDAPSEQEQTQIYGDIAKALGTSRTLVIRTLDVGGDKPLPYLPMPPEENPFLGVRGIRLCLAEPDILRTQVRAILRAAPFSKLHIMFPMIANLEELRAAKAIVLEEKAALGINAEVKVGIMVEVPATAILAEQFAREADFFSIGTNDLTQYTLAMDRGHPKLAKQADALHPGVLNLIALTVQGAHKHGKWVGVCGGIASDPQAVPALIGMGVDELSVSVPSIPAIKALVRKLNKADCEKVAAEVLQMGTAAEVRARLSKLAEG